MKVSCRLEGWDDFAPTQARNKALGESGVDVVMGVLEASGVCAEPTNHTHPVDIITQHFGIEVKTFVRNRSQVFMSRRQRVSKRAWCKEHGLKGLTVVVLYEGLDPDSERYTETARLLYRPGFKNFLITGMRDFSEVISFPHVDGGVR